MESIGTLANVDPSGEVQLPEPLQKLSTILEELSESLATGNSDLRTAALDATKFIFDISVKSEQFSKPHITELLTSLGPSQAPKTRSKASSQIQDAQHDDPAKNIFDFTPLKSLFIEDMDEEQVWAQLDLRTQAICRMLDFVLEGGSLANDQEEDEGDETDSEEEVGHPFKDVSEGLDRGEDIDELLNKYGLDKEDLEELLREESMDDSEENSEVDMAMDGVELNEGESLSEEEGISPLRDPSDEESDRSKPLLRLSSTSSRKKKKYGHPELDDGFFNLAEFNAETERVEANSSSKGRLSGDDSEEEDMDVDLFSNVNLTKKFDDEEPIDTELFYADFFEPLRSAPAVSSSKGNPVAKKGRVQFHEEVRVKRIKATGKNRSLHHDSENEEDEEDSDGEVDEEFGGEDEDEMEDDEEGDLNDDSEEGDEEEEPESHQETIDRFKDDLFADDDEIEDDLTKHERRMTALKEQISELEAENVAPKEWMLMGEAASRSRPQNSLLEEDLEFDRIMKAVPVVTEEAIKTLEDRIKARILENNFNDVVRVRPYEEKPFLPSKLFELQDTKSTQSLAQIYENDYLASQAGGVVMDDRDGKLKKEHDEIDTLWESICGKLDALSNAHFVPKQPKATITTVSNVATASLESALPTTKSTSTMLAPEEVFSHEPSSLRARSELNPSEKRSQRVKARKLKKRQRDALEKNVDKFARSKGGIGNIKKQKQAALQSVVKHGKGVTIVGKNVTGKDKRKKRTPS